MSNNDDDDDELSRSFPGENESFFQKFFTNCICKILFVYRTACVGLMTVRGSRKIMAVYIAANLLKLMVSNSRKYIF